MDIVNCGLDVTNKFFVKFWQRKPQSALEVKIGELMKQENIHVAFVREMMKKLTGLESRHDWSKDDYYILVCVIKFAFRCDKVEDVFQKEVERHYELEDHHPEHADYSRQPMSFSAVEEMAIDRLSRNLQFNDHRINKAQMLQFMPKYRQTAIDVIGYTAKKQMSDVYVAAIEKYTSAVVSKWHEIVIKKT